MDDITDQSTAEDHSATFVCHIKINYPEIGLSWYKGTEKLEPGAKYDISSVGDRHTLRINKCTPKDQGDYRVVCGSHMSNARLNVSGESCLVLSPISCCICSLLMSIQSVFITFTH